MQRRSFVQHSIVLPLLGSAALASTTARAQSWPDRPINLVVPYPPGGNTDFVARLTAEYLTRALGTSVVVENRSGAGGTIAATHAAKQAADGYTLFLSSIAQISLAPFLYKIRYDPIKDFVPVANVAGNPQVLIVPAQSPHKTLQDFISYGRANPGKLSMAHAGTGSMSFLAGAVLLKRAGIDAVMVPYKGGAPAIADTIAGQTDAYTANISEILPFLQGNRLRMLGVTSPQPLAMLPGVPTVASSIPGFQTETWNGLMAPAKLPEPIAERLSAAVLQMLSDPTALAKMAKAGLVPQTGQQTPKDFARRIQEDTALWRPLIKEIGVTPE